MILQSYNISGRLEISSLISGSQASPVQFIFKIFNLKYSTNFKYFLLLQVHKPLQCNLHRSSGDLHIALEHPTLHRTQHLLQGDFFIFIEYWFYLINITTHKSTHATGYFFIFIECWFYSIKTTTHNSTPAKGNFIFLFWFYFMNWTISKSLYRTQYLL